MAKVYAKIDVKFQKNIEGQIRDGMRKSIETMALAFERAAKIITTEEDHVITGRYRSSINLNRDDGIQRDTVSETKDGDGIHRFMGDTTIQVGSNVEYAVDLEGRYGIMGRAMDQSRSEMKELFTSSMKKQIKWLQ